MLVLQEEHDEATAHLQVDPASRSETFKRKRDRLGASNSNKQLRKMRVWVCIDVRRSFSALSHDILKHFLAVNVALQPLFAYDIDHYGACAKP